jgi:cyclopropane fatty-acyl-phospholipid synthase-like methyltransferase
MSADAPASAAGYHHAHLTHDPARTIVWSVVAAHLARWVPETAHVLEIGAGYCDWINHVRAARRVGVDLWPELPRYAARGVEAHVLDVTGDLRSLGAGAFDVVLASNVLEHFAPDTASQVVADVRALLRHGGRFIIVQPNFRHAWRRYFDDYTHRAIFTDVSLPALLRSRGFAIDHVEARFLPYSMQGAGALVKPWLVRAYLRSPIRPRAGQMLVVARTIEGAASSPSGGATP